MVVSAPKILHAALWLVAALFGVAMLFAMLEASFFAVIQVLVYIGAIAILVIFAVMLTRRAMVDEGAQVDIHVRRLDPHHLEVQVRDTGIGIKAEDINRLFTEFEQLDSGTARRFEGTGLGLALTKKIIEFQGGRIGVQSEPGKGSVFTVVLPVMTGEGQTP